MPKRKVFRWECQTCKRWFEEVPPTGFLEIKEYLCGYDGMIMMLQVLDAEEWRGKGPLLQEPI